MAKQGGSARAQRVQVTEKHPTGEGFADYADAFEISKSKSDQRTVEQWARDGFGGLPLSTRKAGMLAHRHMLGFRLGPWSSPEHIFGWRIVSSQPKVLHLEARGERLVGHMLWRAQDERLVMTTFVHFKKALQSPLVWAIAAPIHRRGVPNLLRLAAKRGPHHGK
jgi:hypothetical protein